MIVDFAKIPPNGKIHISESDITVEFVGDPSALRKGPFSVTITIYAKQDLVLLFPLVPYQDFLRFNVHATGEVLLGFAPPVGFVQVYAHSLNCDPEFLKGESPMVDFDYDPPRDRNEMTISPILTAEEKLDMLLRHLRLDFVPPGEVHESGRRASVSRSWRILPSGE